MTNVMPIARKALSATCFDINTRFSVERKFGAAKEKYKITAKSAMKCAAASGSVRATRPWR
jgi:hypothetical protein